MHNCRSSRFFLIFISPDNEGDMLNLSMVHYSFENEEHRVLPCPHGISKTRSSYVQKMPSTICKLHEASEHLPPKYAVGKVTKSVGGLTGASSASKLPRNRQQSADCRRTLFTSRKATSKARLVV